MRILFIIIGGIVFIMLSIAYFIWAFTSIGNEVHSLPGYIAMSAFIIASWATCLYGFILIIIES